MIRVTVILVSFFLPLSTFAKNKAPMDLSALFEKVNPSVVVIRTTESMPVGLMTAKVGSLGSGVLIDRSLVMTAAHVVGLADDVKVEFLSGELIDARVIAASRAADVALLELSTPPKKPVIAELGDSDKASIGQPIFVIGAPYGVEHTLSVGHLSGRMREQRITDTLVKQDFLQTDAAINQGNSGGPMFDMQGRVIGIVSFILSQSGGFEGLGFAASINLAKALLLDQKTFWGGVDGVLLTGPEAYALNVPQSAAVLIQRISERSPLERFGLQGGMIPATVAGQELILGGDIVLEVAGISVAQSNELELIMDALTKTPPGKTIKVKILRRGRIFELKGTLP